MHPYPMNISGCRWIFKAVSEAWAPSLLFTVNIHAWLGKMNVSQADAPSLLLCAPPGGSRRWGAAEGRNSPQPPAKSFLGEEPWHCALGLAKKEPVARKQQRANFCAGTTGARREHVSTGLSAHDLHGHEQDQNQALVLCYNTKRIRELCLSSSGYLPMPLWYQHNK